MFGMDGTEVTTVTTVLSAIAAAAGAGAGDAVKGMVKDSVTGMRDRLLALVRGSLADDKLGAAKLTVYAADPTADNAATLQGHLERAGLEDQSQILPLARELIQAAGPNAAGQGSIAAAVVTQVINDNGTGFQGGSHVHNRS